jgi:hypothetical protein
MLRTLAVVSLVVGLGVSEAAAQAVSIVGTGAADCSTYLNQIAKDRVFEREYFAWAQGFMSGVVMRSPPGRDENLRLTPIEFPIRAQMVFLKEYCTKNGEEKDFADAVLALFQKLHEYSKQP